MYSYVTFTAKEGMSVNKNDLFNKNEIVGESIFPPFSTGMSRWLAMSILQKAIRRGEEAFALRAAATLLRDAPVPFWRRMYIIAFEDIGLATPDLVSEASFLTKRKRVREVHGGEWATAAGLIRRMARSTKSRAADDLAMIAYAHPGYGETRIRLSQAHEDDLIEYFVDGDCIVRRMIAAWYLMGTDSFRPVMPPRTGNVLALMEALACIGLDADDMNLARGVIKARGEVLPLAYLLLKAQHPCKSRIVKDPMPEARIIGEAPSWAFDFHVREGNQSIAAFLEIDCPTTAWMRENIDRRQRVKALGRVLFRIESALVDKRLFWPLGDRLKTMADLECRGIPPAQATTLWGLLESDIPVLNEVRVGIMASHLGRAS
jgi:hypothetical protein